MNSQAKLAIFSSLMAIGILALSMRETAKDRESIMSQAKSIEQLKAINANNALIYDTQLKQAEMYAAEQIQKAKHEVPKNGTIEHFVPPNYAVDISLSGRKVYAETNIGTYPQRLSFIIVPMETNVDCNLYLNSGSFTNQNH